MGLIEMEIAAQHWKGMLCGCGRSAEHVALDLLRLAGRGPLQEPSHVSLEEHVWSPAALWEPAPAVTAVALAALADEVAPTVRGWFLDLLQRMVAGEGTDWESARRGLDLPDLCQNLAAQGLWLLYEEVMSNRSLGAVGTAFEILTVMEPDRARLQGVREVAARLVARVLPDRTVRRRRPPKSCPRPLTSLEPLMADRRRLPLARAAG